MTQEPIQLEGHCYVLIQGNWIHPIAHRRYELLWYPERGLTLLERHHYQPYVKSIVTEDAWLIGCYPREKVRVVYEDGSWQCPDIQTYAASHNGITLRLLGIRSTIPAMTFDGGKEIQQWAIEYQQRIAKSRQLALDKP